MYETFLLRNVTYPMSAVDWIDHVNPLSANVTK